MGWRRGNLGYLLFAATHALIRDKLHAVHRAGFTELTDAQLALFEHLDGPGTRLTELATRTGVAKQSMIELVDRAERSRLVERRADPDDRRAKLVVPTQAGCELADVVTRAIDQANARFAMIVGGAATTLILQTLTAYTGDSGQPPTLATMLSASERKFVRTVLAAVHRQAHPDVTEALLTLFRNLELDGARLTEVAAVARVTKQSMRALVDRAEALGLVARWAESSDGRAKTIRFSAAGFAMLEDMRGGVAEAERDFARGQGQDRLEDLKHVLGEAIGTYSRGSLAAASAAHCSAKPSCRSWNAAPTVWKSRQ